VERAEFALLLSAVLLAQRSQKVEGGLGLGRVGRLGGQPFDLEVALAVLHGDGGCAEVTGLKVEIEVTEVEGVEAQLDSLTGEGAIDLVGVVLERDGGVAAHLALLTPEKGEAQSLGVGGADVFETGAVALERGLVGGGMDVAVVDTLDPGQEGVVEVGQGGDVGGFDLGQELGAQGGEEALLLPLGLGGVGRSLNALDPLACEAKPVAQAAANWVEE